MSIEASANERIQRLPSSEIGAEAVESANWQAKELASDSSYIDDYLVEFMEKDLGSQLKAERLKIAGSSTERRQQLTESLQSDGVSPFIGGIIARAIQELPPELNSPTFAAAGILTVKAMTYQKPNKRYAMPNRSFLNVLQWYESQTATTESNLETPVTSAHKDKYERNLRKLVKQDVLPSSAQDRLALLYETTLAHDDGKSMESLGGYHSLVMGAVIRSDYVGTAHEESIVFHEFTHAITAKNITSEGDCEKNAGFSSMNGEVFRIFNEAMTEFVAEALLDDHDGDITYVDERNLVIALCECSNGAITSRDFVDAFFAGENSPNNAVKLMEKIKQTYTSGLRSKLRNSQRTQSMNDLDALQNITINLYADWAKQNVHTVDDATFTADRIIGVANKEVSVPRFLTQSSSNI